MFRIIFGPVRLLIKQWALSRGGFDLREKGEHLLDALRILLSTNPAGQPREPGK
ncbi:hypothetical protein SDC9_192697 [bioreactor metagenome]|uniref:Uncharacterized protein n=1 Tax=bioreactor metagenome TaxID=1076179 RepID=A0A645I1U8_9ZZZZ